MGFKGTKTKLMGIFAVSCLAVSANSTDCSTHQVHSQNSALSITISCFLVNTTRELIPKLDLLHADDINWNACRRNAVLHDQHQHAVRDIEQFPTHNVREVPQRRTKNCELRRPPGDRGHAYLRCSKPGISRSLCQQQFPTFNHQPGNLPRRVQH